MPAVIVPSHNLSRPVHVDAAAATASLSLSSGQPPPQPFAPIVDAQRPTLLDKIGVTQADRVLVLGLPSIELMCDAVRHGCRGACEALTPPKRPEPADVVVVPRVASAVEALILADCAWKALAASADDGRLALVLSGSDPLVIARSVTERLRAYGFSRIRLSPWIEGQFLLLCNMRASLTSRGLGSRK